MNSGSTRFRPPSFKPVETVELRMTGLNTVALIPKPMVPLRPPRLAGLEHAPGRSRRDGPPPTRPVRRSSRSFQMRSGERLFCPSSEVLTNEFDRNEFDGSGPGPLPNELHNSGVLNLTERPHNQFIGWPNGGCKPLEESHQCQRAAVSDKTKKTLCLVHAKLIESNKIR